MIIFQEFHEVSHFAIAAGCFDRRFTEKRQEEEEGLKNTIVFKEEEGQEEGRSLSSLKQQPAASQQLHPLRTHNYLMNSVKYSPPPSSAFFNQFLLSKALTMLSQMIS